MSVATVASGAAEASTTRAAAGAGARAGRAGSATRSAGRQASRQQASPPRHRAAGPADDGARRHGGRQGVAADQAERPGPSRFSTAGIGPSNTYQRWIVAEFLFCVAIISTKPFLKPRGATDDTASPSLAGPFQELSAVCIVFFVLALLANGPRTGKIAAAFGGLITTAALFNAQGSLQALSMIFAKTPSPAGGGGGGSKDTEE